MRINIYSFTDNGIDKATAHSWVVDLCKKIQYENRMVRRHFLRRNKLVDTMLFIRHLDSDKVLILADKMMTSSNTCVRKDKWESIKKIVSSLKERECLTA